MQGFVWAYSLFAMQALRCESQTPPVLNKTEMTSTVIGYKPQSAGVASKALLRPNLEQEDDKNSVRCTLKACGGRKNESLFKMVTDSFGALFHTWENIDSMNWCLSNSEKCKLGIPDISTDLETTQSFAKLDNDQCCVTVRQIQPIFGLLKDAYGAECRVPYLDNKYQIVDRGLCNQTTGCTGICRQEKKLITLLCFPTNQTSPDFRLFEVEGYCSCKAN